MSTAIRVESLNKKYIIGHEKAEQYTALRDVVSNRVKNIFKPNTKRARVYSEDFFALKDISFEIEQGDRIGIIGRNGAGKSTLLKILSRITEPTSGKISIKGKVASLLEVGTGFHPELTGRENIFLNGAILGMSRLDIKKKFDEIVSFSEVEKFLDTPVKRYSSGMYVRLAFAVAAHLEPEILIVDEVLAVGDAQFQKKCLGKMEDVSRNGGRTVLFVSHNLNVIKTLCSKTIFLKNGKMQSFGETNSIIKDYLNSGFESNRFITFNDDNFKLHNEVRLLSMAIRSGENIETPLNNINPISIEIYFQLLRQIKNLRIVISVMDDVENELFSSSSFEVNSIMYDVGEYCSVCKIPGKLLNRGRYKIKMRIDIPGDREVLPAREYLSFDVTDLLFHQMGIIFPDEPKGLLHPELFWTTKKVEQNITDINIIDKFNKVIS
ncbi:polysaccharide ABC transporter ATP-binding protein [Rhodocytophaga aerolata]|uniref:Polysaccharide ABC transporter ATP-binding protein n=1 Tax=Rhodocytophaga aerolata TaxID=455078 RepID=A0ABT8RCG0_9BACT|nr:polysaccharide ABC transporter ATP-binding protein [Rhodocytophaga aerolata]MDO1449791.1 polysaccharide ABC transporter ATP-binding protein [Rhodocytophaga aerolata]